MDENEGSGYYPAYRYYYYVVKFAWTEQNFTLLSNPLNLTLKQWRSELMNASLRCYEKNGSSSDLHLGVEYRFPELSAKKSRHFIFEEATPVPVLITEHNYVSPLKQTLMALWEIWPTFVFWAIWTLVSGIIMWLLVSIKEKISLCKTSFFIILNK